MALASILALDSAAAASDPGENCKACSGGTSYGWASRALHTTSTANCTAAPALALPGEVPDVAQGGADANLDAAVPALVLAGRV